MKLDIDTMMETNCNVPMKEFSIKNSPIAFEILSNKLYSNPILAIVRELLTNAYDAHVAANTTDTPIQVILPDNYNNQFSIRDFGTGLTKDEVINLYTTFFESTKSNDNKFTGGFGLGSKTPFAFTQSFSIISFKDGIKYSFVATKQNGFPSIVLVNTIETDEPNGLQINIPVAESDNDSKYKFRQNLRNYLEYIPEIKVEISGNLIIDYPRELAVWNDKINPDIIYRLYSSRYSDKSHAMVPNRLYVKQGQNIYQIKDELLEENLLLFKQNEVFSYFNQSDFVPVIEVPIGTLGITPSRESLLINDSNKTIVEYIFKEFIASLELVAVNYALTKDDRHSVSLTEIYCRRYTKNISKQSNFMLECVWNRQLQTVLYTIKLEPRDEQGIANTWHYQYGMTYGQPCITSNYFGLSECQPNLIIICKDYNCSTRLAKIKLHDIVQHFNLDQEYYIKVFHSFNDTELKSLIQIVKEIRKSYLNKYFKIKLISAKKLIKNYVIPKPELSDWEKEQKKNEPKKIIVGLYQGTINTESSSDPYFDGKTKYDSYQVDWLCNRIPFNNVMIILCKDRQELNYCIEHYPNMFQILQSKKDKEGIYFLKEKVVKEWYFEKPNMDLGLLNIYFILPSARRYFKQIKIITHDEFIKQIVSNSWRIVVQDDALWEAERAFDNWDSIMKNITNSHIKAYIEKSYIFRKLEIIMKFSHNRVHRDNGGHGHLSKFKRFIDVYDTNKVKQISGDSPLSKVLSDPKVKQFIAYFSGYPHLSGSYRNFLNNGAVRVSTEDRLKDKSLRRLLYLLNE